MIRAKATSLVAALLLIGAAAQPVGAIEAGDLSRALNQNRTYFLWTSPSTGKSVDFPTGMSHLKKVKGGYALTFNEKRLTHAFVEDWATEFCGLLERSAAVSFTDGSGPRLRVALITCR
jgi:hypothetical protein